MAHRIPTDFDGLFGEVVCISHHEVAADENGRDVALEEGMDAVAFQEDEMLDGTAAYLVARGMVEPSRPGVCGHWFADASSSVTAWSA